MSRNIELKTISGRELHIRHNHSKRHVTIKTEATTFRTYPLDKEEFASALYWTGNDVQNFLKYGQYYEVK